MSGRLTGEVALVTGSTRGLGREVARVFAEEGASVVVTGRNVGRGEEVAAGLRQLERRRPSSLPTSASKMTASGWSAPPSRRFGRLSILVNNAYGSDAIAADRPVAELTTADGN